MNKLINHIHLMEDWDYEKNKQIDPAMITLSSNKRVWWKCHKCNHEWETTVGNRGGTLNRGCPICSRKKAAEKTSKRAAEKNNLKEKFPFLAQEWHPTKNESLSSEHVSCSSEKNVWWKCSWCGSEWQAKITKRTNRGYGCPNCSKSSTSFFEQTIYYYIKQIYHDAVNRNLSLDFELDIYIPSIKVGIEYDGVRWHKDSIEKDNKKDEMCRKKNVTLYRFRDPVLERTKSATIIVCKDGEYEGLKKGIIKLFDLLKVTNIPEIDIIKDMSEILALYKRNMKENSLASKFPEIANEWHPTLNKELEPTNVAWSSGKKVWWKCKKCGNEWQASPNHRTKFNKGKNVGCYVCGRKTINVANQIKIINLDTGIIYKSLTEAALSCDGRKGDICACCNGRQKTAFGYRWAYANPNKRRERTFNGKILNVDTGKVFYNSKEAAQWCKGDTRNINRCCNGKTKTAYGYRWEYVIEK